MRKTVRATADRPLSSPAPLALEAADTVGPRGPKLYPLQAALGQQTAMTCIHPPRFAVPYTGFIRGAEITGGAWDVSSRTLPASMAASPVACPPAAPDTPGKVRLN